MVIRLSTTYTHVKPVRNLTTYIVIVYVFSGYMKCSDFRMLSPEKLMLILSKSVHVSHNILHTRRRLNAKTTDIKITHLGILVKENSFQRTLISQIETI